MASSHPNKPRGTPSPEERAAQQQWEFAFEEFRPALQRFLQGRSQVPQTAEDLAQEVYLRILRFPPAEIVQQPQAYLYRIAANVVHDFNLRMRSSPVTCDSSMVEGLAETPANVWRDEVADPIADQQEVEMLMAPLPPAWQAALILRYRDGLSHEQIAQQLKTTIEAVRKYLVRGQARLKLFRQGREQKGNRP